DLMAGRLSQPLVAAEHGVDVEEAEPNRLAGRSFAALGIGDMAAQHLIPAAQAEDVPAVPMMHQQVDVPPLIAQENEIGQGRLRAGQDYQRGIARQGLGRPDQYELYAGFGTQRIEIVEIGDAGEQRRGDLDAAPLTRRASPWPALAAHAWEGQGHTVLGGEQCGVGEIRHDTKTREAGTLADRRDAAVEQARVAAELVYDVAGETP